MITWVTIGIIVGILAVVALYRLKSATLSLTFHNDEQAPEGRDTSRKQLKRKY